MNYNFMCATIEELLGLTQEGWKEIASMDNDKLNEYLLDMTNLERKSKVVNVTGNDDVEIFEAEKIENETNNPFTKARNKRPKRKILSTYNLDIEAKELEKELEDLS